MASCYICLSTYAPLVHLLALLVPPPPSFPAPCPSPGGGGGLGDRHLVNPKRAKPPFKGAVQSIPVESGEHVQEFKVKWSRTKKFYT